MKISLITASLNCARTLAECLDSLEQQTWSNIEHVVVDGASQDATVSMAKGHRRIPETLVSDPDQGIYDALNKGIALATGDVIGFLHSDDFLAAPDVLAKVADAFSDPSVDAVYGDLEYVSKSDSNRVVRYWRSGEFAPEMLRWGWMPPHPTLYVRREWYERLGGFDQNYRIAADYLNILQLFSQPGFRAVYLPEVLVKMRLGGASNRSIRAIFRKSMEDYDALRQVDFGTTQAARALVFKNLSKVTQFRRHRAYS